MPNWVGKFLSWNFGLTSPLLRGRLSGTFEYYIQKTTDLLQSVSLPSTFGSKQLVCNGKDGKNKGFEFTPNGTILTNITDGHGRQAPTCLPTVTNLPNWLLSQR